MTQREREEKPHCTTADAHKNSTSTRKVDIGNSDTSNEWAQNETIGLDKHVNTLRGIVRLL